MKSPFDIDLGQGPKKRKRKLTAADKKRIAAKQGWKCKKCKKALPVRYHIDHIKEFAKGGSDKESNLQALCPNCHAQKTEDDRHKRKQKKIKDAEKKNDLFSITMPGFEPPKKKRGRKKKDDPFDFF